jgi:uncharacterized protein
MGLQVAPVPDTAPPGPGVFVRRVETGSPAARAGAKAGDRLLSVNGTQTTDVNSVRQLLRRLGPTQMFHLTLERAGSVLTLSGQVRAFPVEQHEHGRVELAQVEVSGARLRAILLLPEGVGPFPTLYYLPGAHWASEEYPFDLEQPVPALLGWLARHGFASLRVERFGMGDSDGPACNEVDFEREYAGYEAGLELLTRASWCDRSRTFLMGHSVGAMVAPLLAKELPKALTLRGVVTFGASAIPIVEGLIGALQRYHALTNPDSSAHLKAHSELLRCIVEDRKTPAEVFVTRPELRAVAPAHFTDTSIYRRHVSYYHQLQQQPLDAAWRAVTCPVLNLHGQHDWICALGDSERIASLAPRGTAQQVPSTDHHLAAGRREGIQTSPTSNLKLSSELASVVVNGLKRWC